MADISNSADIIDVRDIIARVEELEGELSEVLACFDTVKEAEQSGCVPEAQAADLEELSQLSELLEDLKGNGGDEQWRGDWYPATLIRDSYFEEAMDDLLEDIGELPRNLPSYLTIAVDYVALQMDYTSTEFDGVTYWYR